MMKEHGVDHCLCVATSAFRSSRNAGDLVREVRERFGLAINIISGELESDLVTRPFRRPGESCLFVDVGGGSTELTLTGPREQWLSVEVGTVRLLQVMERSKERERPLELLKLLKLLENQVGRAFDPGVFTVPQPLVGTGGNLRCLGKLKKTILNKDSPETIRPKHLQAIGDRVMASSSRERVKDWGLSENRAQVIGPACLILETILFKALGGMSWERMELPQGGLVDGVFHFMQEVLQNGEAEGSYRDLEISSFFLS